MADDAADGPLAPGGPGWLRAGLGGDHAVRIPGQPGRGRRRPGRRAVRPADGVRAEPGRPQPDGGPAGRGGLPAGHGAGAPAGPAGGGGADAGPDAGGLAARQPAAHRRRVQRRRLRAGVRHLLRPGAAAGHSGRRGVLPVHPPGRPVPGALCDLRRAEPDGLGRRLAALLAESPGLGPVRRLHQLPHLPLRGLDAPDVAGGAGGRLGRLLPLHPAVRQGAGRLSGPERPAGLPAGRGPGAAGLRRHGLRRPAHGGRQQPGRDGHGLLRAPVRRGHRLHRPHGPGVPRHRRRHRLRPDHVPV